MGEALFHSQHSEQKGQNFKEICSFASRHETEGFLPSGQTKLKVLGVSSDKKMRRREGTERHYGIYSNHN